MQSNLKVNFFSPEFLANPFPMLEMLRSNTSLYRIDSPNGSMWFITRFEDVVRILKDARFSSNPNVKNPQPTALGLENSMLYADEPDHSRLRMLVSKGFTPRFIEGLRPRIEAIAESLLDAVEAEGKMEVMNDYAFPLPIQVISEMLGVPLEDQEIIREGSGALNDQTSADPRRFEKMDTFARYIVTLIEQKRHNPASDLISMLAAIGDTDDRLTQKELVAMVGLLIFAGHETTSSLIGNGLLALLSAPDQFEKLKAEPSLIPNAVEELLRLCGPAVTTLPRYATEDIEVGGQLIRQGEMVNVVIGSADRDSSLFTDPDAVNIARQIERHMAFGHGMHYCLGAPLARLEGQIAFATLIRRLPNLRLAVDPATLTWRGNMVLRGLSVLPVMF